MDRRMDRQIDRQIDRRIGRQIDRQMDRRIGRKIDFMINRRKKSYQSGLYCLNQWIPKKNKKMDILPANLFQPGVNIS